MGAAKFLNGAWKVSPFVYSPCLSVILITLDYNFEVSIQKTEKNMAFCGK
jgi:hypothetical protein